MSLSIPLLGDAPGPSGDPSPRLDTFGAITDRDQLRPVNAVGAVIARVREDGPADRAGILPGDRLVAIDGMLPRDLTDVRIQIQDSERVTLDLERDGTPLVKRVRLDDDLDLGVDF